MRLFAIISTPTITQKRPISAMAVMIQHLASASSVSAKDASALDACISALKSSISALESSIKTLGASSGRWEILAWCCAILVAAGVVGDVVVIVWEYREEKSDWRRGILLPPSHPNSRKLWFGLISTFLIFSGVFGEAGASLELALINSQLRSKTNELRAKSDTLLALTTQLAGVAETSAQGAITKAGEAKTKSDTAGRKADAVSQEADQIDKQLGSALYMMSARRVLDPTGLTEAFRQFKGQTVILTSYIGNVEGWNLCTQLWYVAHNAQMDAINKCGAAGLTPELIIPLSVFAPDPKESFKIGGLITRYAGVGTSSGMKGPRLVIFVGAKSPFIFGATAQTRDVERRAAAAKKTRRHAKP